MSGQTTTPQPQPGAAQEQPAPPPAQSAAEFSQSCRDHEARVAEAIDGLVGSR